jgi:iron complex transport system ATP-binding protein
VISVDTVGTAFGLEAVIIDDPISHSPMVVPMGRFHHGL